MPPHTLAALIIFAVTYSVIAAGKFPWLRLDRAGAAFAGAVAMVVSGAISEDAARDAIDYRTLALLLGMMIVVANLRLSGAFRWLGRALLLNARSGYGLLAMTVALAGVLAAFFINDVVCIALTPLLIETCEALGLDPMPFLIALATASNIGSAATITGNPQNMIVAGFANLHYMRFAMRLAPVALAGLAVDYVIIAYLYRPALSRTWREVKDVSVRQRTVPALMIKSSTIAVAALICFALGFPTHLVALGAAAVLLFTRRLKPQRVFALVDWTMLLMFAGLFVVVGGLQATGVDQLAIKSIGVSRLVHPVMLGVVVTLLSNLVSNVPAVLLFRPIFPALGGSEQVALIISAVSTLAGNLTVVGSIANLIVIEQARRHGVSITFSEYLRVGVPVTILTIVIGLALIQIGL
ncbi:MAG TPA: anion transporter [Candidatus Binataceae bacterium]|nr:anion transporter [Candidatus Binataceae bacterium]